MSAPLDAVDMSVRQIFLDAFARARRPKLTVDPCERCNGEGRLIHEHTCERCNGTGVEPS